MMTTEGLRLCGITYPVSKRCNVKTQPEQIIRDEQAVFTEVVGEVNQGLFSHRLLYNWTSFYNHSSRLLLIRQNAGLRHYSFIFQTPSYIHLLYAVCEYHAMPCKKHCPSIIYYDANE